jgi:hypothetical protein
VLGSQDDRFNLAGPLGLVIGVPILLVVIAVATVTAAAGSTQSDPVGGGGAYPAGSGIPAVYWPMYEAAAEHYEVNPYVIASIHHHESGFSTNPTVRSGWNECKAAGPMQMGVVGVPPYNAPSDGCSASGTWGGYLRAFKPIERARPDSYPLDRRKLPSCEPVSEDVGCVYDDFDAIAGAAMKLRDGGADGSTSSAGTTRALYAYNDSSDYVNKVLTKAREWEELGDAAVDLPDLPVGDTKPRTIERVNAVANAIDKRTKAGRIPYCWGGGHLAKPGLSPSIDDEFGPYCWHGNTKVMGSTRLGLDCSGSVRWLLVQSGYPDPGGLGSGGYGGYLSAGRGEHLTVHYNGAHIWVEIDGRAWQTSEGNLNHGPGWTPMRSAIGYTQGRVAGL